ncbi:hypothetical protein [Herbiconiux sp.]|uniref:hypothetical protein n=1 Tax=Herbiconiux sp. TaxID=1871186 RepID=UPI0025BF13E7|nr:hypothetical protein [Herbiconiux sp.]
MVIVLDRASRVIAGSDRRSLETIGLAIGAISFVLAAFVALLVFGSQSSPIAGPRSIGQFAAIASTPVAILAFVAGRSIVRARAPDRIRPRTLGIRVLDVIDVAGLSIAHAMIALLTWTLIAAVLDQSFVGAEVFAIPSLMLGGATAAVTAYVVFRSATRFDVQRLAVVLVVLLVEGMIVSMLTASDKAWWQDDLSALGNTGSVSSPTFSATLIIAGITLTTLARYATAAIRTSFPRGLRRVRTGLIVVGILLGLVGALPVDQFHAIHTAFAIGTVVVFGTILLCLPWWIPEISRAFVWVSRLVLMAILFLTVLRATGYYSLTAVELFAGTLVFIWIVLFIRNGAALHADRS